MFKVAATFVKGFLLFLVFGCVFFFPFVIYLRYLHVYLFHWQCLGVMARVDGIFKQWMIGIPVLLIVVLAVAAQEW